MRSSLDANQIGTKLSIRLGNNATVTYITGWRRGQFEGVERIPENNEGDYLLSVSLTRIQNSPSHNGFYLIYHVIDDIGGKKLLSRKITESLAMNVALKLRGGLTLEEAKEEICFY